MPTIVNMDERIGKSVGKTLGDEDPFLVHARLLRTTGRLMPRIPYPRGVFRFKTHEEAHEWQWNHMIKAATKHREKDIPDRIFLAEALTEEGITLDPPPRAHVSNADIPTWLKRMVHWFEARSKKRR